MRRIKKKRRKWTAKKPLHLRSQIGSGCYFNGLLEGSVSLAVQMCFSQMSEEPGIETQAAAEEEAAAVAFQPDWCDSAPAGSSTVLRNHDSTPAVRGTWICVFLLLYGFVM